MLLYTMLLYITLLYTMLLYTMPLSTKRLPTHTTTSTASMTTTVEPTLTPERAVTVTVMWREATASSCLTAGCSMSSTTQTITRDTSLMSLTREQPIIPVTSLTRTSNM